MLVGSNTIFNLLSTGIIPATVRNAFDAGRLSGLVVRNDSAGLNSGRNCNPPNSVPKSDRYTEEAVLAGRKSSA